MVPPVSESQKIGSYCLRQISGCVSQRKVSPAVPAPAGRGEFTKRAFLNGRIDLAKAEAVMDLIRSGSAQSELLPSKLILRRTTKNIEGDQ